MRNSKFKVQTGMQGRKLIAHQHQHDIMSEETNTCMTLSKGLFSASLKIGEHTHEAMRNTDEISCATSWANVSHVRLSAAYNSCRRHRSVTWHAKGPQGALIGSDSKANHTDNNLLLIYYLNNVSTQLIWTETALLSHSLSILRRNLYFWNIAQQLSCSSFVKSVHTFRSPCHTWGATSYGLKLCIAWILPL